MFEHNLVKQQLKESMQEKNDVMHKFLQVQNDLNSLTTLVNSRLFDTFDIHKNIFDIKYETNIDVEKEDQEQSDHERGSQHRQ